MVGLYMKKYIELKRAALEKYFDNLNDKQQEAVFAVNGPVLVLAGAGSGKTTVLVNRVANMILFGNAYADETEYSLSDEERLFLSDYDGSRDGDSLSRLRDIVSSAPVKPWNILAITFTNKAAKELKQRLSDIPGSLGEQVNASTFHSACVRILRKEIERLGYSDRFTIYDSDDSRRLIKTCLDHLNLPEKFYPPRTAANIISSCKDKLITPEEYAAQCTSDTREQNYAAVYSEYQTRLRAADALDFDDIIMLTVQLFEKEPDVLEHYRNLYKYVMVDEYQDTNIAQYRLVSLLSEKSRNICVVGDDDQSIYGFRGATVENILDFEEQFDGCTTIRLEQNYRSTRNILNAANSVIANNSMRKEKVLWTDKESSEKLTVHKASDEAGEARFVADIISSGVGSGKAYKDYAVLYRMNAQSNMLEKTFTRSRIPYRVIGGLRFYERKEVKDIIAYLSVINNPSDMLRFKRIINEPKRGVGETTLSMIEQISMDLKQDPVQIMLDSENYAPLNKKSPSLVKAAKLFTYLTEASETLPLDRLFDEVTEKTGYTEMLTAQGEEGLTRLENIEELKSNILSYMEAAESEGETPTLSGFLEEISLYTDVDKLDPDADAVCMMTMHSAKGLEFPVVFIVGMEDGIFPSSRSMDSPESMEEERRLAYVGITRAKEKLYMTYAKQRMLFGSRQWNTRSKFIKEIDKRCIEKEDGTVITHKGSEESISPSGRNYSLREQLAGKKTAAPPEAGCVSYNVGDRVKHNVFGEGTVVSEKPMGNDFLLEIAFDKVGTKKIMANYAKLTRL